jgi:hypothetical protein
MRTRFWGIEGDPNKSIEGIFWRTWPSTRRPRWPFGRATSIPSPLIGWFAIGVQIRANMQTAQLADGSYILVEPEDAVVAREQGTGKNPHFASIMATMDAVAKRDYRSRNRRQGWQPNGNQIEVVITQTDEEWAAWSRRFSDKGIIDRYGARFFVYKAWRHSWSVKGVVVLHEVKTL